jgi:hypothetical protein
MVEKAYRQIETIEKEGNIFESYKSYKSFRTYINSRINKSLNQDNLEMVHLLKSILKIYDNFHPSKDIEVEVENWKGKSSFELIKGIDKLTIVKYQKKDKYSEAQEVRTEVTKEEIVALVDSLKRLNNDKPIRTEKLAMLWSQLLHLGHSEFKTGDKPFFSDRKNHNKLTLMLGSLDKLGLIEYKGGLTRIINKDISLQLIL